jgi:hypothetical protein
LVSERRPCDAALSLAERIEINLAEAFEQYRHFLGNFGPTA